MLKKVRLHGDTLTRFDRCDQRNGKGKIASCSQMLHIETEYSQSASYLSTTSYGLFFEN